MPRVGSRQASLNKLIWFTLLCYLLCSGDKIVVYSSRAKVIPVYTGLLDIILILSREIRSRHSREFMVGLIRLIYFV